MKSIKIILFALFSFSGCTKNTNIAMPIVTDTLKTVNTGPVDTLTYLALGDSYTIGEAVSQNESFPYQLTFLLNSDFRYNNTPFGVSEPRIIATTGWTTDDLINAINISNVLGKKFSFVTLLIGVNDQFQNKSQANYQVKFEQVLKTAIDLANGDVTKVFVLSIPDYGVTPFAAGQDNIIGPKIDQFNSINMAISNKLGVHYLNITEISRQAAANPALIAPDGLHPSALMYKMWMQQLEPIIATEYKK